MGSGWKYCEALRVKPQSMIMGKGRQILFERPLSQTQDLHGFFRPSVWEASGGPCENVNRGRGWVNSPVQSKDFLGTAPTKGLFNYDRS